MPTFHVECRELVYVTRTYEVEAANSDEAKRSVQAFHGSPVMVDEQVTHSYEFCGVIGAERAD